MSIEIKNKEGFICAGCGRTPRKLLKKKKKGYVTLTHKSCGHILSGHE